MLKTTRNGQVWLITQPAHAELSGQMAAHWGNEEFAVPGHFAASADSERLRQEVVLAVAEHDNEWWEWEADPPLSADDGLPQGLGEVVANPWWAWSDGGWAFLGWPNGTPMRACSSAIMRIGSTRRSSILVIHPRPPTTY